MFITIRDQQSRPRRRSHTVGINKNARSSKLSLLSSLTTESHGSSGSTSTITQESHSKDFEKKRKRRKTQMEVARVSKEDDIDVFTFLVKDDKPPPTSSPQPVRLTNLLTDMKGYDSDSGVSMGDSVVLPPEPPKQVLLPPVLEDVGQRNVVEWNMPEPDPFAWRWPEIPPPTHQQAIEWRAFTPAESLSGRECPAPVGSPPLRHDRIASHWSEKDSPLIFRRFSKINHRILLHLQNEIAELEEELDRLDAWDNRLQEERKEAMPMARRLNWEWTHADLQARRYDLMGRLEGKMEQYNQTLLSSTKVHRLQSPLPDDIDKMRTWLQSNDIPIRHLDNENDLARLDSLAPSPPSSSPPPAENSLLFSTCLLAVNVVPLLLFKLMDGVLNRLVLLGMALSLGALVLEKTDQTKLKWSSEWIWGCIATSVLAAILF